MSATHANKSEGDAVKNEIMSNKELAEESRKPILRKFEKQKVHSSFIDIVCGVDLGDMQLIREFNKRNSFLLYFVAIYSKYAWVFPLKDKNGITIIKGFQMIYTSLIVKQTKNE